MRAGIALPALVAAMTVAAAPPAAQGASAVEGRKHVRKASELAATGKCAAAVPEYTAAYDVLNDPVILFNRAECLRKLGRNDEAVADYKQFLTDVPKAPNRAAVEKRITELSPPPPPPPKPVVKAPAATSKPNPFATGPQIQGESLDEPGHHGAVTELPAMAVTSYPRRKATPKPFSTWFWVGVGTVALLAGAAGIYLARRDRTETPVSSLGSYRF